MTLAWTERFASFTPPSVGWNDYDIFTNLSVPKGAIAYIVMAHTNTTAVRTMGVRTDGTLISRYITLNKATTGGASAYGMYVKVNETTGIIDVYADVTSGCTCYLMGYWTGCGFTEVMTDIAGTLTDSTWNARDVFTNQSVPKGAVCSIVAANLATTYIDVGVRTGGSSLANRHIYLPTCAGGSSSAETLTFQVKSDATDGDIELYKAGTGTVRFYLTGYFDDLIDYVELDNVESYASAAWYDFDLTSYFDQEARVMDAIATHYDTAAAHTMGMRANGSALNRYIAIKISPDGYEGFTCPTGTDSGSIMELYNSAASNGFHGVAGYYKEGSGSAPTVTAFSPSATAVVVAGWSGPTYAYADDTNYATTATNDASQTYSGYGITGLSGTITKVRVNGLGFVSNASNTQKLRLNVSPDGGDTWLANHDWVWTNTTTPADHWVDVTSDTTWDWTKLSEIWIKITYVDVGTNRTYSVDHLPVEVTYTADSVTSLTVTETIAGVDGVVVTKTIKISETLAATDSTGLTKSMKVNEAMGTVDAIGPRAMRTPETITAQDVPFLIKALKSAELLDLVDVAALIKLIMINETAQAVDSPKLTKSIKTAELMGFVDAEKLTKILQVLETIEAADAPKLIKALISAELIDLTEALVLVKLIKASETIALTDDVIRTILGSLVSLTVTESIAMTDSAVLGKTLKLSETIGAADAEKLTKLLILSELVQGADSPKLTKSIKTAELMGFVDAEKLTKILQVLETITFTDADKLAKLLVIGEQIGLVDLAKLVKSLRVLDAGALIDSSKLTKALVADEVIALIEDVVRTIAGVAASIVISEAIGVLDETTMSKLLKTAENAVLVDAAALAKVLVASDTVTASDALSLAKSVVVGESVLAQESVKLTKRIIEAEQVRFDDVTALVKSLVASEVIELTDEAQAGLVYHLVLRLTKIYGELRKVGLTGRQAAEQLTGTSGEQEVKGSTGEGHLEGTIEREEFREDNA